MGINDSEYTPDMIRYPSKLTESRPNILRTDPVPTHNATMEAKFTERAGVQTGYVPIPVNVVPTNREKKKTPSQRKTPVVMKTLGRVLMKKVADGSENASLISKRLFFSVYFGLAHQNSSSRTLSIIIFAFSIVSLLISISPELKSIKYSIRSDNLWRKLSVNRVGTLFLVTQR